MKTQLELAYDFAQQGFFIKSPTQDFSIKIIGLIKHLVLVIRS